MERIGGQKIWSYIDGVTKAEAMTNGAVRAGDGHRVRTYFELAKKIAELQFLNREHVLLFRGQVEDHRTSKGNTTMTPTLFRVHNGKVPSVSVLTKRFNRLRHAERL